MNPEIALSLTFGISLALAITTLFAPRRRSLSVRLSGLSDEPIVCPPKRQTQSIPGFIRNLRVSWRSQQHKKVDRAVMELADLIDLLSTSLSAGESIFAALLRVAKRADGELAGSLRKVLAAVELGSSLPSEILQLAEMVPHPQVNEFASKIALSLSRGTPLAQMLKDQSQSVRAEIRARLLREGGRNETRMLIPLVFLILPITVLFAIYPSLRLLNFSFL